MWDLIQPEILQAGTDCRNTDESCPLVKFADDVGPNQPGNFTGWDSERIKSKQELNNMLAQPAPVSTSGQRPDRLSWHHTRGQRHGRIN